MLSKFSVKKPYTVVVAVVLVLLLGFVSFSEMTTDLLPSIDLPYVMVMTSYPGASPEEVETTVSKPVEQALATISNVKKVSSVSSENVSMVMLEFSDDANMDSVSIDIRESLDMVSGYWEDSIGTPTIMKLNPDMLPVMVAAIDMKGKSNIEVSQFVKEKVLPKLESVDGVARVNNQGFIEEQVNVIISQDKIDDVNKKLGDAINKKFDDAEKKTKDAKNKIESGKSELDSKSNSLNTGMTQAEQGITDGKLNILKKEVELEEGEKELKTQEAALKKNEKTLSDQEKELKKQEETVKSGEKQLKKTESTLKSKKKELSDAKSKLNAAISQIKNNAALTQAQKDAALKPLNTQLETIKKGEKEAASGLKTIETKKAEIEKGKKELAAAKKKILEGKKQLNSAKKKLQSAKSQLAAGKQALNTGKQTLNSKEAQLNQQKSKAEQELNKAQQQLESGEKELNEKTSGMDEQKDSALKASDVSSTITNEMVSNILKAQNFTMPAGYITEDGVDYLVRVGDKIKDTQELGSLILFDPGVDGIDPVKLSDVADVFQTDNSAETYTKVNGNEAVAVSIQKQNTYSTSEVSKNLTKRLEQLQKDYKDIHVTYLMDQGMYIGIVVDSVLNNLILGGILAVLILLFFLRDIKPTVIIACSIPISVIFAIALMYFSGVTLNIISLSGLAVGVGMLVDNSVVVIENIYRLRKKGVSAVKASVSGAVQVAGAITSSTLTTICVFVPIVFVKGITRQIFTDMALTIAYSLLASLVVALTLVPMMSSGLLKKTSEKKHGLFDKVLDVYEIILKKALHWKPVVLIGSILLLVISAYGAVKKGTAFMPEMDSTQISVSMKMPEGALLADTTKMSDTVMERIGKIKEVDTIGAMLSSNSLSGAEQTDSMSIYVVLKEKRKRDSQEIAAEIEKKCKDLDCEVTASGSSMDMSALGGSGISVLVKGQNLDDLKQAAKGLASELKKVKGTTNVSDGMEDPDPELRITVDKEKAMKKGFTVAQIYQELQKEIKAEVEATNLEQSSQEYPIVVKNKKNQELNRDDIRKYVLHIKGQDGKEKKVALKDVASVTDTNTLSSIRRQDGSRYITVSAELKEGYNIGLVSADAEKALKKYPLSAGCELEFSGENETINESLFQLVKMLLLGIAFIYLIMVAQFQSLLSPFIVMFTLPLAFTGGFLGLIITNKEVSVISMIGFIMLCGIIVNNGIVLVDYINQLRRDGVEKKDAIIEAGRTRMRPVLMTALTTVLGLSTMAVGMGTGADMMQPIAIVTIGGLLYATLMTLFVIPVLYDLFNRKKMKVIAEEELEVIQDDDERF